MNCTKDDIYKVLQRITYCVDYGKYSIEQNENREKNTNFISKYNITTVRIRDILVELKSEDFCDVVQNAKQGYEHEKLYIFCPQVDLYEAGANDISRINIYIKINIIENAIDDYVVVISFHEAEYPVSHMFE